MSCDKGRCDDMKILEIFLSIFKKILKQLAIRYTGVKTIFFRSTRQESRSVTCQAPEHGLHYQSKKKLKFLENPPMGFRTSVVLANEITLLKVGTCRLFIIMGKS